MPQDLPIEVLCDLFAEPIRRDNLKDERALLLRMLDAEHAFRLSRPALVDAEATALASQHAARHALADADRTLSNARTALHQADHDHELRMHVMQQDSRARGESHVGYAFTAMQLLRARLEGQEVRQ